MRAITALVIRKPGRLVIPEVVVTGEVVRESDEPRRWWQPSEMFRSRPASDYRVPLRSHAGALLDVYG
jgi:hypothetical protein